MKKLLSLAAAFLLCAGVQAQIVSSRSVSIKSAQKQPSETQWFLRGGLNVMKMTGDGAEDSGSKLGYNFVYGFQKPLGSVGTYWGMVRTRFPRLEGRRIRKRLRIQPKLNGPQRTGFSVYFRI